MNTIWGIFYSTYLFDLLDSNFGISRGYIFTSLLIISVIVFYAIVSNAKLPQQLGIQTFVGVQTKLLQSISRNESGKIFLRGEYWDVESSDEIDNSSLVEIVGSNGLTLVVKKVNH